MGPVFIHSLWRSGSTYLWNRFRALPDVYAFYEPFHEALGLATRDELAAQTPEGWAARHPRLDEGYYAEYLPLVKDRGVPGFEKSFSVDHYFEDQDSALAAERPYVASLIAYAEQLGRVPVLACCRTLGRAAWLKAQFGGTHIVLVRDPQQQWYSGHLRKLEAGLAYFETMPFQILGKAKWDPAKIMARLFGIPHFDDPSFFAEHERYFALFGGAEFERSYAIFYAVLCLSLRRALPVADLVVDIDRLSNDPQYQLDTARRVSAKTGLRVSFEDAAVAQHDIRSHAREFGAIEQSVDAMLAWHAPAAVRRTA